MEKFDIAVIGGGPSGYAATMRALDLNKKVILVEQSVIGGAGLHNGALSSKTLWELSKSVYQMKHSELSDGNYNPPPYSKIRQIMEDAVQTRTKQLYFQLDQIQKLHPHLFRFANGKGTLLNQNVVEITYPDKPSETIYAHNIIIATGSRPRKLPAIPIDEKIIMTSDGIHHLEDFPESLVILGAGVIGCEFATIFANFGKTQVFLIDKADRILPFEDEDVAQMVADNLEHLGVHIHKNASLLSMEIEDGRVKYILDFKDGKTQTFYAEKALVSVGRVPNLEGLGLQNAGLSFNSKGYVDTKDGQSEVPNIYFIGDTTADICLVNVGELEGRHVVEKIYGKAQPLIYENISTIMFLHPEVAGVGMNEIEAQKKGIPYQVATYTYDYIGRALCMRCPKGFFKILVTDDEHKKILGMRAVGEHASTAIQGVALLISQNLSIEAIAELIHPHPSIIEGIQECARMLLGKSIIKPEFFSNSLYCFRIYDGHRQKI
jgi:dihydrolipoamide dehydrogenase